MLKSEQRRKDLLVVAILATIVFNICYNISVFPDYFGDEGTYVERAINFLKTYQVYQNPDYIDHPPLGWIIPSLVFVAVGFPDSIIHLTNENLDQQILTLVLIPRLIEAVFVAITSILIYKIAMKFYDNKNFAIMSLATFALIPAIWSLRDLLLDPLMIMFVLLSLFVLVLNGKYSKESKITSTKTTVLSPYQLTLSGALFGIALLVKLTAIFFLPAVLLFAMKYGLDQNLQKKTTIPEQDNNHDVIFEHPSLKQRIRSGIFFIIPIFIGLILWMIYFLISQHTLSHLISTQLWQISRPNVIFYGVGLPFLLIASPIGVIFGIFGLSRTLINRQNRLWSLLPLPYFGFLFRGGYVNWSHVLPLLPILSIYAGKPLHQLIQKIVLTRNKKLERDENVSDKITTYFVVVIIVISLLVTFWIASFDAGKSQREAIQFLINNLPRDSLLVTNPGYGWIIQAYRPDLQIIDAYTLQYMNKIPDSFYFAEKPDRPYDDPIVKQSERIFEKSCIVNTFNNSPSEYLHPYSTIQNGWWNVQIRHFDVKGCIP